MSEIWKDAPGWEGLYEISDLGRVKSVPRLVKCFEGSKTLGGNVVSAFKCSNGYMAVNLTSSGRRKQVMVHGLVLQAFCGKRPAGFDACHFNGDRADNRLANLRWDTKSGNASDKHRHGTMPIGERSPNAKLRENDIPEIRASGLSAARIAKNYGVSKSCIQACRALRNWGHV